MRRTCCPKGAIKQRNLYIYTYINVLSFYLRIKDGNMKMMIMMREEGIHLKL